MHRRQARLAGRGDRRQGQPAHRGHRPHHRRRAEGDRRQGLHLRPVDDQQLGRHRPHDQHRERGRDRRDQQVAEGHRTDQPQRDRPVAAGFGRGRHRDAGNQQDAAHRHGGAVRAAARGQHPAAGSAHRSACEPELAGAGAGVARGGIRLHHERRLDPHRHHDQGARRADPRVQQQDDGRARRACRPCPASSNCTAGPSPTPPRRSRRATAAPARRSRRASPCWSRSLRRSSSAPPISTSG